MQAALKVEPAQFGIVQRHRSAQNVVGQHRRNKEQRRRAPEHRQDITGRLLAFACVFAEDENPDHRQDKYPNQNGRVVAPYRTRDIDTAVGHRDAITQQHRGPAPFAEGTRLRHCFGHDRKNRDDPQQQGHVAEPLDVDRDQARHQPVFGQAQNTGKDPQDRCQHTAQKRDQNSVQNPHQRGAPVGRFGTIFDQTLVNIVSRRLG